MKGPKVTPYSRPLSALTTPIWMRCGGKPQAQGMTFPVEDRRKLVFKMRTLPAASLQDWVRWHKSILHKLACKETPWRGVSP